MEDDGDMKGEGVGTMVTALAWVGRGFAKPILDSFEPTEKELAKNQKMAGKLLKGKGKDQELSAAVKEAEQQMENMDMNSEDDEDDEDGMIFTPELARLKAKE